jgi:chromosome segregation ATPase
MEQDRALRDLLEETQGQLKHARARLEELESQSTEALQDQVAAMLARLEQGDEVRESWANKLATLERELKIARTEQSRLQSQLETVALERKLDVREFRARRAMVLSLMTISVLLATAIGMLVFFLFRH